MHPTLALDHITVIAKTLDQGRQYVADQIGIWVPDGGQHPKMGTHNALMSLGSDEFLEIIAIDPSARAINLPRWFGLDEFDGEPALATWVLGTTDIASALKATPQPRGAAEVISRGDLTWQISIAADGRLPMQGAFPTLIQWPAGSHPAGRMTDLGCRLTALEVGHPNADVISQFTTDRLNDPRIQILTNAEYGLFAQLDTPDGVRTLA